MLKNWLISIGYFFGMFLVATFIITILNYFNLLSSNIITIIKLLIPIIAIFIVGFKLGTNSKQKGYLEGLKIGLTIISIFILLVLLLDTVTIKSFLYYLILLLTSILRSMIGINKKKI